MNYGQLFETIKGYVENEFPSTQFTDSTGGRARLRPKSRLIRLSSRLKQRIFNSVQFPSLRKNVTALTSAFPADPRAMYLNAPGDFLAPYSIAVIDNSGNYEYLLNKDVNYLRAAYANPSTTGIPKYYALFGPATTNSNPPDHYNRVNFSVSAYS
jgi:hypothetical protein